MLRTAKKRHSTRLLVILGLVIVLAGCAEGPDPDLGSIDEQYLLGVKIDRRPLTIEDVHKTALKLEYETLVKSTADGKVTRTEYEEAHKQWVDCKLANGLWKQASVTYVDPLDSRTLFTEFDPIAETYTKEQMDAERQCNIVYSPVAELYIQSIPENQLRVAPNLYANIAECLQRKGWKINPDGYKLEHMLNGLENRITHPEIVEQCVRDGMNKHYPHAGTIRMAF